MAVSVVSLGLNAAGVAGSLSGVGEIFRNITFFDQEKLEFSDKAFADNPFDKFIEYKLTEGGANIFNGLPFYGTAVMGAVFDQSGKMCDFPVESGAMISDHKIIMPRIITVQLVMPGILAGRVIDQLNLYYKQSKKIVIQSFTGIYRNLILESMPVSVKPENVSRPIYDLKFREVLLVEPDYTGETQNPANKADGDTKKTSVISDYISGIPGVDGALDFIGSF